MANEAFLPVQNLSLQTSALQSSTLVNTFNSNVLRVVTGSLSTPLAGTAMPLLDSYGNPIILSAQDVVLSVAVASSDIVSSASGALEVGLATGPNVSPSALVTILEAQINAGYSAYKDPGTVPGSNIYVTGRCTAGNFSGNSIKVTLLTLSPK
jgi:hypothetical protein